MSTVFDDLLVESPLVKAEMDRLRYLHGVYEMALHMAIVEANPEWDDSDRVQEKMDGLIGRAEVMVRGA